MDSQSQEKWARNQNYGPDNRCSIINLVVFVILGLSADFAIVGTTTTFGILTLMNIVNIPIWSGGILIGFAGSYILTSVMTVPLTILGLGVTNSIRKNCCPNRGYRKIN